MQQGKFYRKIADGTPFEHALQSLDITTFSKAVDMWREQAQPWGLSPNNASSYSPSARLGVIHFGVLPLMCENVFLEALETQNLKP